MEKLMYVVWRPTGQTETAFRDTLVSQLGPTLAALGAQDVSINVADEHVAAAGGPRITQLDPPLDGFVSLWVDAAADRAPFEERIVAVTARAWPFLVVESVPQRNTTNRAAAGVRTNGINMVACITPKLGMAYEAFIQHWHVTHKQVALETQCTYAYVRNEIVRRFSPDAPPWAALVEEGFPAHAVTNPLAWYSAGTDEKLYQRNFGRMMDSCNAFLALDRIESHPMSEYRFAP
jgi:hypothetical protein